MVFRVHAPLDFEWIHIAAIHMRAFIILSDGTVKLPGKVTLVNQGAAVCVHFEGDS